MKKDNRLLEILISHLLRVGVLIAGFLLLAGWITQIDFQHDTFVQFKTYQVIPLVKELSRLQDAHEWGLLTSYLGLAVLISLPLIRVLMTGFIFLKEREYILAALAGLVFSALIFSFALGIEV